jgi:excisionase family DNA binding protein
VHNLTVPEALERLRISRATFYELVARHEITTHTIGRRRFVSERALLEFIERRERAAAGR